MVILAPGKPDPYTTAADLILSLPAKTADARNRLGITTKTQAAQIGIGTATLTRLEALGSNPTQSTILACLRWLAEN